MASLPDHFFLNKQLHQKLAVVRSDSKVLVFNYQEEDKFFVPLLTTLKHYRKAFTYSKSASLIGTTPAKLREIVENGLHPAPEKSYDLATFKPKTAYFSEDDLLVLRQICYDLLPKNKYGIPYRDDLASEDELIHRMRLTDDRDFVRVGNDGTIRIYRA